MSKNNEKYYVSENLNVDPFPFRVGKVRVAFPGWLNGEKTVFDPRPEYARIAWRLAESLKNEKPIFNQGLDNGSLRP